MTKYNFTLTDENIIRISFNYDPEAVIVVKSFSVRTWNPTLSCWEIPLHICNEIPIVLKVEIPQIIKERYEYIYTKQPIKFNPILLRPEIIPYPFQISGIEFLSSNKNSLLSDEVGLGKTLQAIATALHLNCKKVLVVCPASVKRQWQREIQKFTDKSCIVIEGTLKQREKQYTQDCMFFVVNYELVMRDLLIINLRVWDMVIADEVSRIKNFKSRTKSALIKVKTIFKLGLSATPLENDIQELHSIFSWINPITLGTYWNFINEYCYFSSSTYGGYQITGIKDSKKLHETLKEIMIRRKKSDVFKELPEIVHNEFYVPLTPIQQKMYREIETNILNLVQKDEFGDNILNQIMYLRELCNSPRLLNKELKENGKVDEIIEIVKQFSSEHKLVIFSQWTKFLDLLEDELKNINMESVSIRGDIKQEQREENITRFNTDPNIRIMLCSEAGGVGLNLQVADVLVHCDLLWNPMKMQQREGRIHRIGQKNTVNVITVMTDHTIEEKVYNILQTKKELFDKIIEGKDIESINQEIIRKIFKNK